MEAVKAAIEPEVEFVTARPASTEEIAAIHTPEHIRNVEQDGLYAISALAAGGAVQAATWGLTEPCFGLIRPPGHHASADSAWGFCHFNNMAVALESLKRRNRIATAYVLDIDMHYGDGTENICRDKDWVAIHNPSSQDRATYMEKVLRRLDACTADIIGISAGFDNHLEDWGGVLHTRDYFVIGQKVREVSLGNGAGCFAILEGGYNHDVLGQNVLALIRGLSGKGVMP